MAEKSSQKMPVVMAQVSPRRIATASKAATAPEKEA
jgi:hypothetical protein